MKKTTALLLLMVASLSLPVSAQPIVAPPASQIDLQADASVRTITVNRANGLVDAVTRAQTMLQADEVKEVVIHITTCEAQQLPHFIIARGKITIVGCNDVPAGIDAKLGIQRTMLTPPANGLVDINTPVEFRGVEINNVRGQLFHVADGLTIANSVFNGIPSMFGTPLLFEVDLSERVQQNVVVIRDSRISGLKPVEVKHRSAALTFINNVVTSELSTNQSLVEIAQSMAYPGDGSLPVVIENNDLEVNANIGSASAVKIARGDVQVRDNRIVMKGAATASGVALFNPREVTIKPLKNVAITYNLFNGAYAITNTSGKPIETNAVTINDNDFSMVTGVLPKAIAGENVANASVSEGEVINAQQNVWGKVDRAKVAADTSNPKDTYTRPVPPEGPKPPVPPGEQPGPMGPDSPGVPVPPGPKQPDPQQPPAPAPAPQQPQPQQPSPQVPTPTPSPSVSPAAPRSAVRVAGETRFETAVKVAQEAFKDGAKAVVLARGDVAADSVSAVPFAEEIDAPVLLSPSDALHPAAEAEIKRLLPKGGKVFVMGGEAAIAKPVADAVVKLGVEVERVAGPNRAATAVETAKRLQALGKVKQVVIANGADWQADLIAGPAAAAVDGVTLLTNGDKVAPETEAFLKGLSGIKPVAIGTDAAKAVPSAESVTGADGTELSVAVAKKFFGAPKAVGVATTADFADALAGGVLVADQDGPLVLSPGTVPASITDYLKAQKTVSKVYVFGGAQRFNDAQLETLTK